MFHGHANRTVGRGLRQQGVMHVLDEPNDARHDARCQQIHQHEIAEHIRRIPQGVQKPLGYPTFS